MIYNPPYIVYTFSTQLCALIMTTKFIGIKEFRQNISKLYKKAKKKNLRYIVLNHNKPVLDVRPITEKDITLEKLAEEIAEAREQVKRGEIYTHEEAKKILGL